MPRKRFIDLDEGFECGRCGLEVPPLGRGTCRNHCPRCLTSCHVDGEVPGDRAAECGSLMTPVEARVEGRRGTMLVHRCDACGAERVNKVAVDGPGVVAPDDMEAVIELMHRRAEDLPG